MNPPSPTHEGKCDCGNTVKITWFDDGAYAVVHIMRPKSGVTFNISRSEAEVLRAFLPAYAPDDHEAGFLQSANAALDRF